ncbi:diguanylate cyclase domain-containing protein [Aquisalibacillus elongatus]|uniref:Diguanylate cyclase/phosphodiesterase n=1 Tax=Aquisalibacillus elongatus TaxID=485577 RepID=A0A3N5C3C7_9BACI|nr:diguanylate cyclase [Aquisalibacillus elongatus]RPF53932.1 diguanylate cyclase/phosphodiesterase [Aquisalibacillus elongatus]
MEKIAVSYDYPIVIISIIIAVFASFTTIELMRRTMQTIKQKHLWLLVSALTMGVGIWSMHFAGMLALESDVRFEYDIISTTTSLIIAIIASYAAFYFITFRKTTNLVLSLSAILLGTGISSMHYLGMHGMTVMNIDLSYDLLWVVISVLTGILGSGIALYVFANVNKEYLYVYQLLIATLLGFAISGLHYSAMKAVSIYNTVQGHDHFYQVWTVPAHSDYLLVAIVTVMFTIFIAMNTLTLRERIIQSEINYLAFHDPLTGLPNRNMLDQYIQESLLRGQKYNQPFSLFFLDLNDFKEINDTHGHDVGDSILVKVSERLSSSLRQGDVVTRLGGDEFIIVLDRIGADGAKEVAERILESFIEPIRVDGQEFKVKPSIGISIYPKDGQDMETLMKQADQAMYSAKNDDDRYMKRAD